MLAEREERRGELAAEEGRPQRCFVEAERGVVLRELVGRDRRLRRGGDEGVQRRRVGERGERRIRGGELLHRGELLRPHGERAVQRREPAVEREDTDERDVEGDRGGRGTEGNARDL